MSDARDADPLSGFVTEGRTLAANNVLRAKMIADDPILIGIGRERRDMLEHTILQHLGWAQRDALARGGPPWARPRKSV
jgi:hypothetical protein